MLQLPDGLVYSNDFPFALKEYKQEGLNMQYPDFFDCSCFIGRRAVLHPGSFWKKEDLVQHMGRYGIRRAMVYHAMAREHSPEEGNKYLQEEIMEYPQLFPVWVVMHHHTGEFPEPDELLLQMKAAGVRAVRMFPSANDHKYSISEWNCGELFTMLEEHRIPLMMGMDQLTWDELHTLLGNHPQMRFILTDVNYSSDRNLYALMEKFCYLNIETIGYKVCGGIAEICRKFGAQRLVFGSGMPFYSGSAAVSMITYADIEAREKRMIASENLEKLLGGASYD